MACALTISAVIAVALVLLAVVCIVSAMVRSSQITRIEEERWRQ